MQEGNALVYTFVFALVIIFLVLAAQYESFRDPFIILIALPTSIFGALMPLNAGLGTINIYTQIGLVTPDRPDLQARYLDGRFRQQAAGGERLQPSRGDRRGGGLRLRPILMTTAATVVAMMPLLIAGGAGAASRFAIGVVIAAGMTIGTLFTLFVTPAVYTYLARDHQKAARAARAASADAEVPVKRSPARTLSQPPRRQRLTPSSLRLRPHRASLGPRSAKVGGGGFPRRRNRPSQGRHPVYSVPANL